MLPLNNWPTYSNYVYTQDTTLSQMHATMSKGFLDITDQNPNISKSNPLQHVIFQFFFMNLRYIA